MKAVHRKSRQEEIQNKELTCGLWKLKALSEAGLSWFSPLEVSCFCVPPYD